MHLRTGLTRSNLFQYVQEKKLKGKIYFSTLGSYLSYKLTGENLNCHLTEASASGLVELKTQQWSNNIIEKLELDNIVFPRIVDEKHCSGFFNKQVKIFPAIANLQAAILGLVPLPRNDLLIEIDTISRMVIMDYELNQGPYDTLPVVEDIYLNLISFQEDEGEVNEIIDNFYNLHKSLIIDEKPDKIHLYGDFGKDNLFLRKLINNRFNLEVKVSTLEKETIAGLYQIALITSGICRNINEARSRVVFGI